MSAYRVTETEVGKAVLAILADTSSGGASIASLKAEIPKYLKLSEIDRTPSTTRPGEELWEQQVRNLVSHRGTAGNVICEGYVDYKPRYLKITERGWKRAKGT